MHWDFKLEESTLTITTELNCQYTPRFISSANSTGIVLSKNGNKHSAASTSEVVLISQEEKEGCVAARAVNCPSVW